jgi:hypothetical protein
LALPTLYDSASEALVRMATIKACSARLHETNIVVVLRRDRQADRARRGWSQGKTRLTIARRVAVSRWFPGLEWLWRKLEGMALELASGFQ